MSPTEFKLLNEGENYKQTHGSAFTSLIDDYQNIIRQIPQYSTGGKGTGSKPGFDLKRFCAENLVSGGSVASLKKDISNAMFFFKHPSVWEFVLDHHSNNGWPAFFTQSLLHTCIPKLSKESPETILKFFQQLSTKTTITAGQASGLATQITTRERFLNSAIFENYKKNNTEDQIKKMVEQVEHGDLDAKLTFDPNYSFLQSSETEPGMYFLSLVQQFLTNIRRVFFSSLFTT